MLSMTNRQSRSLSRHFRVKFADLVSRYPALATYFAFPAEEDAGLTAEGQQIRQHRAIT